MPLQNARHAKRAAGPEAAQAQSMICVEEDD